MSRGKTVLLCLSAWIAASLATCAVPIAIDRLPRAEHKQLVAFSDFLHDVEHGRVISIRVHGRVYTFVVAGGDGGNVERRTIGPSADAAQLATLRPLDPLASPPQVTVE